MGILFLCENCSFPLNIKVRLAGKKAYCPQCEFKFVIPEESEITASEYKRRHRELKPQEESEAKDDEQQLRQPQDATPEISAEKTSVVASEHTTEEYQPPESSSDLQPASPDLSKTDPVEKFRQPEAVAAAPSATADRFVASPPGQPPVKEDLFSETDKSVWYVRPPSGGQFGPATGALMRQWLGEGRITDDSYIWQEGWEDWKVAGQIIPHLPASQVNAIENSFASGPEPSGVSRHSAAYKRRQRRRTMWGIIGLVIGSVAVVALIVALLIVINQM